MEYRRFFTEPPVSDVKRDLFARDSVTSIRLSFLIVDYVKIYLTLIYHGPIM